MNLKPGKYLRSASNGHIYIHDAETAAIPTMRVVYIDDSGKVVGDEDPVVEAVPAAPVAELRREDLEALFIEKYKRKPHPRMGTEKLRAAVEGANGNDPGHSNS